MQYLNILYFLILTVLCYQFLHSEGRIVKSPFNDGNQLALTGPEMYWVIVFSTGLLALSVSFGIDLMAIRLGVIMILCIIGFRVAAHSPIWSPPLIIYSVYLVWLVIGCFYAPSWNYGIRALLKYAYPLVFCLFASAVVDNFPTAFKAAVCARWVALIVLIISFLRIENIVIPGVIWYITARTIHFIGIMIFSFTLIFFTNEKKKNLIYFIVFLVPCFVFVLRTSILGSAVALMSFAIIRWKLKSIPFILIVLILGVASVFLIPSIKQKMFFDKNITFEQLQSDNFNMEKVNTNYRQRLWEQLPDMLYKGHEIVGSGTGASQELMYNHSNLFGGLKIAHSDFVQMKCDNGLIGLILYSIMIAGIFIHCFLIYWKTDDPRIKLFAITAGASILGIFATSYSDNTVNYSMATLSVPFGFYGMTLALNKRLA